MNPQTETNINEAIDWLQKTGGAIQDFAAEQMPIYCREVVAWQFWTGLALSLVCLPGIFIAARLFAAANRTMKKDEDPFGWILGGVLSLVVCLPILLISSSQWIKAAVAPRIVIVEHFKDFGK